MTIRRNGQWTLDKAESGRYIVREDGKERATILTDEYNAGLGVDVALNTYEVRDFSGVEAKFEELSTGDGGLF